VSAANLCFFSNYMMNHLPAETTNFFGDDPHLFIKIDFQNRFVADPLNLYEE
jgi:hypothetical protein